MRTFLLIGGLVLLAGCGYKQDPSGDACTGLDHIKGIFYESSANPENNAKRILDASCISCHCGEDAACDNNGAPEQADYRDYAGASDYAELIASRTGSGVMPPPEDIDNVEVMDVIREDRCRLQRWFEEGAQQ